MVFVVCWTFNLETQEVEKIRFRTGTVCVYVSSEITALSIVESRSYCKYFSLSVFQFEVRLIVVTFFTTHKNFCGPTFFTISGEQSHKSSAGLTF